MHYPHGMIQPRKPNWGLWLLGTYCLAAVIFLLTGTGALWLRSWGPATIRPYSISSSSMTPTLAASDYIYAVMYTWQRPQVERGDVVMHSRGGFPDDTFVSRVVGMPGEEIQMKSGRLYINNQLVDRQRVEDFADRDFFGRPVLTPRYKEQFPEGHEHFIVERDGERGYFDNTSVVQVPEGHLFVMGDNRDNSSDSRDPTMGAIPIKNVFGYPILVVWSKNPDRIGLRPQ